MSTINTKLLADAYAALVVAENQMRDCRASNYNAATWQQVWNARHDLQDAMRRLPPVVVSVTEPAPIPQHIREGATA